MTATLIAAPDNRSIALPPGNYREASVKGPYIALTFDDGPNEPYTSRILDILRKENVKATFFVCGRPLEMKSATLRRIVEEGHEVGNHGYSHRKLTEISFAEAKSEIIRTEKLIADVIGRRPYVFRPPNWAIDKRLTSFLIEQEYAISFASVSSFDYNTSSVEKVVRNCVNPTKQGDVILLHDGLNAKLGADRSVTVEALPAIIAGLRKKGLKFVTFSELHSGI